MNVYAALITASEWAIAFVITKVVEIKKALKYFNVFFLSR